MSRKLVASTAMMALVMLRAASGEIAVEGLILDETSAPVTGARIQLQPADGPDGAKFTAESDATGVFRLLVPPGEYLMSAERPGFFALTPRTMDFRKPPNQIQITLNHVVEHAETVDVVAAASPVNSEGITSERQLTGAQIINVPYPASRNFRNALRLMPGVVQDQKGSLHFDGGLENQVYYSLDGFNVSDPVTGRFSTRLSIEAVRSLEYTSGRYSPEFGKGSAGSLNIQTTSGDDRFRYTATNFIPGVDTRHGIHIGTWAPRVGVSGPIQRGRIWFAENLEAEYNQRVVPDLEPGADRTTHVRGSNLLHGQVNVTPGNILLVNLLGTYENAPRTGLGALDPMSTTIDRRGHQWFFSLKDQIYLGGGMLFEAGYGRNRTQVDDRPQGSGFYIMTPDGRAGNHFLRAVQESDRDQFLVNMYLPSFQAAGAHQVKFGADLNRVAYRQNAHRTGYEHYGSAGYLLSRTTFGGNGSLLIRNTEASSYVVDSWRVRKDVVLEYGIRQDWDRMVDRMLFSPRVAVSWAARSNGPRLSAGYAVVFDASNLAMFARPFDQYAITTKFQADGSVAEPASASVFRLDGRKLRAPRYRNWTFGLEQDFPARLRFAARFLAKRGEDGFTYVHVPGQEEQQTIFVMSNLRRDVYDAASFTLHHSFGKEYEWMVNYTRSRALSNAVLDIGVDQPLRVANNFGRQGWDAPNRLLSWGYLPGWNPKWAVSYLLEYRSGYPFSVQTETGEIVGAVNSYRFPRYFGLNIHLERRLRLLNYHIAVRGGFNNITNNPNVTGVNNVLGSPRFMTYYGLEGRHLVFRLRLLGRE